MGDCKSELLRRGGYIYLLTVKVLKLAFREKINKSNLEFQVVSWRPW